MEQAQAFELLHKLETEIASVDATLEAMKVEFEDCTKPSTMALQQIANEYDVYTEVVNIQHDLQAKWLKWRLDRLQKALVRFYE